MTKINIPKEFCDTTTVVGASGGDNGGGGARAPKRKGDVLSEDPSADRRHKKLLKPMVEEYHDVCAKTNSRTTGPVHLGDKIFGMGGADSKTKMGGVGIESVTEKEETKWGTGIGRNDEGKSYI